MSRSADGVHWQADPEVGTDYRSALLFKVIQAHGLDAAEIEEAHPEVLRALKTACTLCTLTNHCVRSVRERTAAVAGQAFCLNAPVLNALADYERTAKTGPFCRRDTKRYLAR
jgi:hypothetical protein